jgi:hypothetical protein
MDIHSATEEGGAPRRRRLTAQERIDRALSETRDENQAVVVQFDELVEMIDAHTIDFTLLRQYIAIATYWTWRERQRSQRGRARHRAMAAAGDKESIKSLGAALAQPLLDFVMMDGTPLRDATIAQVEASEQHFGAQGRTMLHISRFLAAVRTGMDDDKTVGESIDEETARRLFDEARAE